MTARCGRTTWKSSQTGHFNVLDRLSDAPRFGGGSARPHDLDRKAGRPRVPFLHRLYRDLAYIAAAVLAIIGFETALNIPFRFIGSASWARATAIGWRSDFGSQSSLRC
jgi:hypothetical protein